MEVYDLLIGRFRILNEARKEFSWIKQATLKDVERLNELQDLRDYLRETYQLSDFKKQKYSMIQQELTGLINEIDRYWWNLFTKGTKANG